MKRHIYASLTGRLKMPKEILSTWESEGVQETELFYDKDRLMVQALYVGIPPPIPEKNQTVKRMTLTEIRQFDAPTVSGKIPLTVPPMFTLEYDREKMRVKVTPYKAQCALCGHYRSRLKEVHRDVYVCQMCVDRIMDYHHIPVMRPKDMVATVEMKQAILEAYRVSILDFPYEKMLLELAELQESLKNVDISEGVQSNLMHLQLDKIGDFRRLYNLYRASVLSEEQLKALTPDEKNQMMSLMGNDDWNSVVNSGMYGTILGRTMPLNGVYHVKGTEGSGYVVDLRRYFLSWRAIVYGNRFGSYVLYNDNDSSLIIRHILLNKQLECMQADDADSFMDKTLLGDCFKQPLKQTIKEIEKTGAIVYPAYFGEYPKPAQTPEGKVAESIRIENGIYLVYSNKKNMLAVGMPLAKERLSKYANQIGQEVDGEYIFFKEDAISVPLFEFKYISACHFETDYMIVSDELLFTCLNQKYPDYVHAIKKNWPTVGQKLSGYEASGSNPNSINFMPLPVWE